MATARSTASTFTATAATTLARPARTARSSWPSARARSRAGGAAALARREARRVLLPRSLRLRGGRALVDDAGARLCCLGRVAEHRACCRTTAPGTPSGTSPSSRGCSSCSQRVQPSRSRCSNPACCGRRSRCSRSSAHLAHASGAAADELVPCENCSFAPCQYRRAPRRARVHAADVKSCYGQREALRATGRVSDALTRRDGADRGAFPLRRHDLHQHGPPARFRLPREARARATTAIRSSTQQCTPAPDDTATRSCAATRRRQLMPAIAHEKPLAGRPLDDVLRWRGPPCPPGCYCEPRQPRAQMGAGARNDSLRAGQQDSRPKLMNRLSLPKPSDDAHAARRRRDGHAADARRPRAGQLRRGVEPDASRARARDPAALRRGRLGLHPHQHLRRLAHHAQSPRQRRRRGGDQPGRRSRSRARRSAAATATSSATSARSAA